MTARLPTEFRYWDNQDTPSALRMRRLFKLVFRADPDLPDALIQRIGQDYFHADPVAERFVDEVYIGRSAAEGRRLIEAALAQGVDAVEDAPESLRALFSEIEQKPAWYDEELVNLGAKAFRRYGSTMFSFLGAATLEAYGENSVTKPLSLTGAYAGDTAMQRFLETVAFWIDVSEPGGLLPGGEGRKTALRVRMMHVFVRRRLASHPEWKEADWGVPISAADALTTLLAGSVAPGLALKLLGYRPTDREIEAMMHFWRYTGYLMGVQPTWYPDNITDAARYMYYQFTRGADLAGEDGKQLCQSYVKAFEPKSDATKSRWQKVAKRIDYYKQLGYVGVFVSPGTRRKNELPRVGLWPLYPVLRFPLLFCWETARRHSQRLDELHDRFARKERKQWLDRNLGQRKAEYNAVSQFSR